MTSDPERIVGLYQRHAQEWVSDRNRQPFYEGAWLVRFCSLLAAGAPVLDIGCGSGQPIARYLIEKGHPVTGVDSSPEMIAMCVTQFPGSDWRVADMRSLTLGQLFGGIIAWDSFFHLCHDDQRRMFPIFRKHAAKNAALMLTSGHYHGEATGCLKGEPLYHASLDAAEYNALFYAHGFEVIAHVVEDSTCGGRTIWLAKLK